MDKKQLVWVIILMVLELTAVNFIKLWSSKGWNWYLALGIISYTLVGIVFAHVLYISSDMTVVNSLWQVLNIILVTAIGILFYKEKVTVQQKIGVFLAITSTLFLSFS